ncbi:uncharacterized protein LOC129747642 isoform X2 [Uranotaenia lowii]|uniref:uncharacterized protein LOC129747642 isoform X2 n=1 Tax=Uranotaenia lowii TaxID=190385 RepID=UPI00247B11D1|nr:uncharacterized protein LOC129747642 isoform X2 [Uranotaenia lowii]
MDEDLNQLSNAIIASIERTNNILASGRLESKLLQNADLPDRLLKLTRQDYLPGKEVRTIDPSSRLTVEDVDNLFTKIRQRSGPTAGRLARTATLKKSTVPLQQSRILNETNLVGSQSGSLTDLSDSGKQTSTVAAIKNIDVETLVRSLKQSAEALGQIENRTLEPIDFERVDRYNRRECLKVRDTLRDVDTMIEDLEKYINSEQCSDEGKKELISTNLVEKLRELSEVMSQVLFIKNNEYVPDMSKTLLVETFPLAECLDDVGENIRQKKLYQ